MLRLMNRYRAAFHDARSGSVCSFRLFGPNTTDRIAPIGETCRWCLFDAMVDYDAMLITHQDNVACRPSYPKKLIEFLSGSEGYSFGSLPVVFQFSGG